MAAFDYPKNEGVAFVEQEELIAIRRQLHQIPEIGLEEKETQAFLLNEIDKMKQPYLQVRTSAKIANVPFQMLPPKLFQIGASLYIIGKILFKKSSYPGIGILLINTAKAPKIINGIVTTNASRIATKCRCAAITDAFGIKCFSIH